MQHLLHIRTKLRNNSLVALFPVLFISLFFPGKIFSQPDLPDTIVSLWGRYRNAGNDSMRVVYLSKLAFFYNDYVEDKNKADSLADAAIRVAELSLRPDLLLFAYNSYLESTSNDDFFQKSIAYANQALQKCRITNNMEMRWRTCRNLAQVYLSKYIVANALSASSDAFLIANALKNNNMIAESYLCIGNSHEFKNQMVEAYQNYFIATDMAEKIGDRALLEKCYRQMSKFYSDNKLFDDAIEFNQKRSTIILKAKPIDSVALMWINLDLQFIEVRQHIGLNVKNVKEIIDFAIRKRHNRMKAWEFALYRKSLLESDEVVMLYNFYKNSYPDEFEKLFYTDTEMYYRLKAYFTELEKKPDSASYYFRKAEQLVVGSSGMSGIYKSNFYIRYGQFLVRQGHNREAIEKFTRSYKLGEEDAFFGKFEYMLTASRHLEKLYRELGDYKNAWHYASMNLWISDSINTITKNDRIMAEAVKRERSLKEIGAERDRQKIRQGKNERNMMAGGVVFFIIVSLLVYRNYRSQKRLNALLDESKRQSDHLLLNILPHETAEELKATGKASAKRYDEVTVMFTDFKDFTQASERMSAEELVAEINFYFTEFDTIISRHNIEKIKIIGDSYMCAGGLPVANETHAYDVVAAAKELQKFMMAQQKERNSQGRSCFELRIGIHTGPVVAGVVGLKKFAFDIWGDTVNTASRMENAGEPNKVNISGETHEKIKDRFKCIYRGKIAAKHKGEIDMYFVE